MGWWECYDGTVIGDELADIVGDWVDNLVEDLVKRYPTITRDQVLSTMAFCSGYLKHFDKDGDIEATVNMNKILTVMTIEQMRNWYDQNRLPPDMGKRVAPDTELVNVFNPFTGDIV